MGRKLEAIAVASILATLVGTAVLSILLPVIGAWSLASAWSRITEGGVYVALFSILPVGVVILLVAAGVAVAGVDLASKRGRMIGLSIGALVGAVSLGIFTEGALIPVLIGMTAGLASSATLLFVYGQVE